MRKKITSGAIPEGGGPLRGSVTAQTTIKRRNVPRNYRENTGRVSTYADIKGVVELTSSKKQFAAGMYGA